MKHSRHLLPALAEVRDASRWGRGLLFATLALAFAWLALSPQARAACQEGCDLNHFNTFLGEEALNMNTTGSDNTATGWIALAANTAGFANTATGSDALGNNTLGFGNTANGAYALANNVDGSNNTATGASALLNNRIGNYNTANGYEALFSNSANYNTADGFQALYSNTSGDSNAAHGFQALFSNISGSNNTAQGFQALFSNTTSSYNTANGYEALFWNSYGDANAASGYKALFNNTTGVDNTAHGFQALFNNTTGSSNTATGFSALLNNTTGSNNIALGLAAGQYLTTGDNNIDIGNQGVAGESGVVRIGTAGTQGATFIAGIRGTPITAALAVGITADGQLGVRGSSARFKEAIQPMDQASSAILALRPVSFRYRKGLDPHRTPQFGLIAEEVAKVDPDLVVTDEQGQPFSVRYEEVNAMLLNEFLKEHRRVKNQGAAINQLKSALAQQERDFQSTVSQLQSDIKAQAERLQEASDQSLSEDAFAPSIIDEIDDGKTN